MVSIDYITLCLFFFKANKKIKVLLCMMLIPVTLALKKLRQNDHYVFMANQATHQYPVIKKIFFLEIGVVVLVKDNDRDKM